ncbi:MAG: hypothetical protein ACK5AL_08520 [Planctomycetota bacterium]|jgi:hypothetical protein
MNIGTQLMVIGTGAKSYDTPWFPKGADNAYFTYEIIHQNFGSGGSISVTAYTKNREDAGSEGTSFSFTQIGSTAFWHAPCTNWKQLVRFKITVTPGTSPTGPEGVCYRILPPTWYDKAV